MDFIKSPMEIEKKSFEIITQTIGARELDRRHENIIKRVIHTSADFDYLDNLVFSPHVTQTACSLLKQGADIVTDTRMAEAGINKKALRALGGSTHCFIDNEEVAQTAKETGTTRSAVAVDYALDTLTGPVIYVVGNAPTALIRLYEIVKAGGRSPELIVAMPVGFVNVVESKELIMELDVPSITAKGRKGGSNVAAAVCNALLYELVER